MENIQQIKILRYEKHIINDHLKCYFVPCKHVGGEDQGSSHLGCDAVILAPVYQNTGKLEDIK